MLKEINLLNEKFDGAVEFQDAEFRIEEIKKEVALLFAKNGIEGGLIHKTYIDYMNGNREEGYKPYIDSRVRFKGIRQLDKLMKEFKEINRG